TGNTNDDRYPSVFASQGYAYIAYQGDDGGGDNDIMYNYSTDYGENWADIVDLTNDASNEIYPRLYGDAQKIGVDYVYDNNRVRFNYSIDNGITWLGTPETVDDNSTVNSNYHSVGLLHTSSYWHAAWEDTRNADIEIYASRRILGQGDITHQPEILTFNYDFAFSGGYYADKYVIYHVPEPIDSKLADVMRTSSEDELIPVFIMLAKQLNYDWLVPQAEQMSKLDRRKFVIRECQALANDDQKALLVYLRQKESEHKVSDIVSQWTTNTVCLKAKPEIIREIAQRNDIWGIGYSEPLQIIGVVATEEPAYEHIEFVPEDGREICWGVAKINADDVWTLGYTGAGVIVGHMDSGVNYNHTDLQDHMWDGSPTYPHHGWDFSSGDDDPMDTDGHGTQTSGIVAGDGTSGSQTGVAPDAQIMALRIFPGTNTEMGNAIAYAMSNDADLLSCSIGWEDPSNAIKDWCRGQSITIYAAGIVWCNAAGNGRSVPPYGHYTVPQDINSPADCPGPYYAPNGGNSASIAIGATNQSDDVASWSSYGPTEWDTGTWNDYPWNPEPGLMKPDVAAPGVNCKSLDHSTNNGYDTGINGTSFAQPHHAGTVALMLERNPALTPHQIDSLIQETAIDIETAGRDSLSGAGRIDALQAVNAVSEGAKWAQLWVINQASATGILDVTGITQDEGVPWIISVSPTQFTVPIDDSQAVWVTTDTTAMGLIWGQWYYDTLLVWSNSIFDDNPERVPVILIMATVGIEEDEYLTPRANANLLSILPNPFTTSVKIDYAIPCAQDVNFTIYDVCGKKVKTFVDGYQEPGQFSVTWTGCDEKGRKLAAGIYFGRIELGKHAVTNKLILIR
ncbi:S8 family serine peptidase, partial [candidate division WOR-3 bacterium]|nr:S8 family serine peptidase [candidate division WOR-3 bacterium]